MSQKSRYLSLNDTASQMDISMPAYTTQFDLDIDDLERIETALRERSSELSMERIALQDNEDADKISDLETELVETNDLLGRLHNQKVFYRPKEVKQGAYVSG